MLNLKRQTLYGYVSKKQIPFSKTMGKLYFSKLDLQNWIKSGCKAVENKHITVDNQLAKAVRKGK
ncbi:MAG: helix-turn-helix domain-containing protein [Bacteroidota bacterium]